MKALLLILPIAISLVPTIGGEFKSLKVDDPAKASFVERLSEVKLAVVNIKNMNLSVAMFKICRDNGGKGQPPIVNFVVSFPRGEISADPFSDDPIEKAKIDPLVSYRAKEVPFTDVLDSICTQAGYVWSVAEDGEGHSFLLIEYKGEQDGTGQPATRSESKSEGSDNPQPDSEGRSR